jgi:hypothetical protein
MSDFIAKYASPRKVVTLICEHCNWSRECRGIIRLVRPVWPISQARSAAATHFRRAHNDSIPTITEQQTKARP